MHICVGVKGVKGDGIGVLLSRTHIRWSRHLEPGARFAVRSVLLWVIFALLLIVIGCNWVWLCLKEN